MTVDILSPTQIKERLKDSTFLPSIAELNRAYPPDDDPDGVLRDHFGGQTLEILTKEFIEAFGSYLATLTQKYGVTPEQPLTILEVGAGYGGLSYFIRNYLDRYASGRFNIIATDSGRLKLPEPAFPVEIGDDYKTALDKYQPDVVICSWMPAGADWIGDFRSLESVKEYILIGIPELCGRSESWGEKVGNRVVVRNIDDFQPVVLQNVVVTQLINQPHLLQYFSGPTTTVSYQRV